MQHQRKSTNAIHKTDGDTVATDIEMRTVQRSDCIPLEDLEKGDIDLMYPPFNDKEYTYVRDKIMTHIFGAPLSGRRQFFYMLDPFKPEQFLRAPKLFDDINIAFALFYFAGLIVFAIYAIFQYTNQSPVEVNSMSLSTSLSPIYLNITITCSQPYACGLWTTQPNASTIETTPITYKQQWSHVPNTSPCTTNNQASYSMNILTNSLSSWNNLDSTVCYSDSPNDGLFFTIPFNSTSAYLTVEIRGNSNYYTNDMFTELIIGPQQWKTVFFSQTYHVTTVGKGTGTYSPYVADLFYNGHPPGTASASPSLSSSLRIRLQQFGYTTKTSFPQTFLTTMGAVGGFASLWLTIVSMVRGTAVMTYKSAFVLKGAHTKGGLCANACQLGFLAFAKILGCCSSSK